MEGLGRAGYGCRVWRVANPLVSKSLGALRVSRCLDPSTPKPTKPGKMHSKLSHATQTSKIKRAEVDGRK